MKHLITVFVMLLVSAGYIFGFSMFENAQAEKRTPTAQSGHYGSQQHPKTTMDIYFKRVYMDGQTTVNVKHMTIWSVKNLRSKYSGWQLASENSDKIVLKKKVHDISPLLKASGYFGLSKEDILTIYKGKPDDKKAIHSFFQIKVKKLESGLQHELQQGIPVQSKGHYQQVIKHLKKYEAKRQ